MVAPRMGSKIERASKGLGFLFLCTPVSAAGGGFVLSGGFDGAGGVSVWGMVAHLKHGVGAVGLWVFNSLAPVFSLAGVDIFEGVAQPEQASFCPWLPLAHQL